MNGGLNPLGGFYELFQDEKETASVSRHQGEAFPAHFHRSIEIHYTLSGELTGTLDGCDYSLPAGWVQVSSPYMNHGFSTRSSSETLVVIIPLSFVPTFEKTLSGKVFASPVLQDDEEQTFFRLITLLETAPVENIALRKGLCYTILGLLSQRLLLADAPIDRHMDFIRQTLQYLEDHYASPLRVESVAACFGYSRSRFSRLFQEHVGCSMPAYLAMLRCRHAAHLLRQSTLKVAQIGLQVGFESLRTFYRTFQNVYGVTPRQFRDQ